MVSPTDGYPLSVIPGYYASQPGIQIATQLAATAKEQAGLPMPATADEEDMQFARQLGIEWVMTGLDDPREHTLENYLALKRKFEANGLKIYRLANHSCHNMEEVTLNLPGRDAKIAEYLAYIRMLGAAGIYYATYAHMGNGIWSTGTERIRGGATSRAFHLEEAKTGRWRDKSWHAPLTHSRAYSEEELWDNYTHFIKQVVPVAEEAGVYIGIHPDDPPVYP
ncbi:MAG: mannonate dehydratase, partial [Anaerolineae bacterium]